MGLEGSYKNKENRAKLIFKKIEPELYDVQFELEDGTIQGPERIHLSMAVDSYHITSGKLLDNCIISIGENIVLNAKDVYFREEE